MTKLPNQYTGNSFNDVIDQNTSWWVVQYLHEVGKSKKYRFRGVALPKADYSKWYESEKKKVKVEIK
jgi:hypothetical protein